MDFTEAPSPRPHPTPRHPTHAQSHSRTVQYKLPRGRAAIYYFGAVGPPLPHSPSRGDPSGSIRKDYIITKKPTGKTNVSSFFFFM